MLTIVWMMMKEELRFHTNFASKVSFFLFPIAAILGGAVAPMGLQNISSDISYTQLTLYIHMGIFFYGFSVASITFFGREYIERQFGHVNFLLSTPKNLPWSFKKAYAAYFIHDIGFYLGITLLPLTIGGLISSFFIDVHYSYVLFFALALFLSFNLGMALSFFSSAVYSRGRNAFAIYFVLLLGTMITNLYFFGEEPTYLIPSHSFLLHGSLLHLGLTVGYILVLFGIALLFIQEHLEVRNRAFTTELSSLIRTFRKVGRYSIFLAKEWLDIKRSRTISKMLFSTVMPMIVITGLSWFIERGFSISLGFNIIFYSAMIGYFQVITYSWLNNTDTVDYYDSLPVTVSQVIKTKILVCVSIASCISILFVILMAILLGQALLLLLAIPVMMVNIFYIVTVTAFLTGLRTNSALFDVKILSKFSAFSMIPLLFIMVQSRLISDHMLITTVTIVGMCIIMIGVIILLYRGIERKWSGVGFIL
jgi:hypothetical protein